LKGRRPALPANESVQTTDVVVDFRVRFMAADQPDESLRMHFMAMAIGGILQRHRALGSVVGDHSFCCGNFGGIRAAFDLDMDSSLASRVVTRHNYPAPDR